MSISVFTSYSHHTFWNVCRLCFFTGLWKQKNSTLSLKRCGFEGSRCFSFISAGHLLIIAATTEVRMCIAKGKDSKLAMVWKFVFFFGKCLRNHIVDGYLPQSTIFLRSCSIPVYPSPMRSVPALENVDTRRFAQEALKQNLRIIFGILKFMGAFPNDPSSMLLYEWFLIREWYPHAPMSFIHWFV